MTANFVPSVRTTDLISAANLRVGKHQHAKVMDLIAALRSPEDEELLIHMYHGRKQEEIADLMGVHQSNVSRRLMRLLKRAK